MNRHERLAEEVDPGQSVRAHVRRERVTVTMNGPSHAPGPVPVAGGRADGGPASHGAQTEAGQAGI